MTLQQCTEHANLFPPEVFAQGVLIPRADLNRFCYRHGGRNSNLQVVKKISNILILEFNGKMSEDDSGSEEVQAKGTKRAPTAPVGKQAPGPSSVITGHLEQI
jgi:hypothetical protein